MDRRVIRLLIGSDPMDWLLGSPEPYAAVRGCGGRPRRSSEDVKASAEIAACLIACNVDRETGRVTPRSCYQSFETFSFGQKKPASPFAAPCWCSWP